MLPFHNVGLFSKPNRFGSVRLGSACSVNEPFSLATPMTREYVIERNCRAKTRSRSVCNVSSTVLYAVRLQGALCTSVSLVLNYCVSALLLRVIMQWLVACSVNRFFDDGTMN